MVKIENEKLTVDGKTKCCPSTAKWSVEKGSTIIEGVQCGPWCAQFMIVDQKTALLGCCGMTYTLNE